jgi:hypothetical protein
MAEINADRLGWRVANAVLWYVVLVVGCFSREAYDVVRRLARVNPFDAWVNNPWFLPIALSYVVGRFVRNRGLSNGLNAVSALYEGVGFGLISLVAFSALPIGYLMVPLPPSARPLYLGYALKFGCWLYLAVRLTCYLVCAKDDAFFRARAHRYVTRDSMSDDG